MHGLDTREKPAVGLIATSDNAEEIVRTVVRASEHGYNTLVTHRDASEDESIQLARRLGACIIPPPDADLDTDSLKRYLSERAKSLDTPGFIFQADVTERIDFERSMQALDDGDFVTHAVTETPAVQSDGGLQYGDSDVDTLSEDGSIPQRVDSSSIEDQEPLSSEAVDGSLSQQSTVAIIPAYNEEGSIRDIITATQVYVDDVIVIDDSSSDDTREIAAEHADGVVTHPKNMGVGGAVHTGYLAAFREGYDIIIQIDGDGQHDPSYIPEMVDKVVEDDVDMVIGSRWLNNSYKDYSFVRRAGIKFFTIEANVLGGLNITDVTSGFRAYRTSMLEELGRSENSHWALEQTLEAARKGYDIEEVSVPMPPETEGSQFNIETFLKYPPRMLLTTFKVLLFR